MRILNVIFIGGCALALSQVSMARILPETFADPPDEAKPKTWMHVMNQSLSREGLEKDLQRISDAGLGGALIFSVEVAMPKGPVKFNSPEFRSIIHDGVKKSDELGLEIGVHNCDGWTSSGGPWVPVEESMKRVVFSETIVDGGAVDLTLEKPRMMHDFYRDIGVVAIPSTAAEQAGLANKPTLSASSQKGLALLDDGKDDTAFVAKKAVGEKSPWIQFSYDRPFIARSIYLETTTRDVTAELQTSNDGKSFKKLTNLRQIRIGKYLWSFDNALNHVEARFFRVRFNRDAELAYVSLSPDRRMPDWKGQVSMLSSPDSSLHRALTGQKIPGIPKLDEVVDLTTSFSPEGRLKAQLPAGKWRIYRFGYTTTGAKNSPATAGGKGFECDKLKASALDLHFAAYVGKLAEESGPLAGKAFRFSEIDSYEMGGQNWTENYAEMFKAAYGYDLVKFLPLYAGREIESLETSSAVLRDLRHFTCNLMTENYYKRFTELCHQHGMRSYIENYGFGPINGLDAGAFTDIPMGEFWIDERPATHYSNPISAAHIYGKPVISAESFTSATVPNWGVHPYMLKAIGDHAWTMGINEFMFHRYAHQANTKVVPGMSMNMFGSHIDGTQTWWLNAGKEWMKYIQRGSWMLRQGVPVSDLLIYVGEGSPHRPASRKSLKGFPNTNNFDSCNTDVLMNRISVEGGKLMLPEGTTYQALHLENPDEMSLKLLKRIGELAEAGATIVCSKPKQPIGYEEQQTKREEFNRLADEIWKKYAKNLLKPGFWEEALKAAKIEPDYLVKEDPGATFIHRIDGGTDFYFIHNPDDKARDMEVSFRISDRIPELWYPDTGKVEVQARFTRRDGRIEMPISFDPRGSVFVVFRKPIDGFDSIVAVDPEGADLIMSDGRSIELRTELSGSFLLTYASGRTRQIVVPAVSKPLDVDGGWKVEFDGLGIKEPSNLEFSKLGDWKDHERDDIRYFSGTAVYRKVLEVPESWMGEGRRIHLDLGMVSIAAEVRLNGKDVGILWKPPFRADISNAIHPGKNDLEIRLTNQWVNRLVGDERFKRTDGYNRQNEFMPEWYSNNEPLPAGERTTFSAYQFYDKPSTHVLKPSGLLGPVTLVQEVIVPVDR